MESKRPSGRPLRDGCGKKPKLEQSPPSLTQRSTYGVPVSLNLDCKVFLSHSGSDKEFVRLLYAALCSRYHAKEVAFFDEKTLPRAQAINMENILEEARRCQLGVLVFSENFFVQTPNPMLELQAFTSTKVRLLPLFFGISVEEFKQKSRTRSWEEQWRKWSIKQLGERSNVEEVIEAWRHSLDLVTIFSGLEYKKIATSHLEYIYKIVDEVTRIIPPLCLLSEEGVCGKNRLCKMVDNMYKKCAAKHSSSGDRMSSEVASTSANFGIKEEFSGFTTLDLVGIYGFSGLGKSTLCKCLCDFYFAEFNGRVCYIDVGSSFADQASSQKHSMLSTLSTCNKNDFHHSQFIEQGKTLINEQCLSMKDPIFIAIDNILTDRKSQEEASFYLSREFPKGSRIFLNSRSESILMNLASLHSCSFSVVIEYIPALTREEAVDIFVNEFPDLRKVGFSNLEDDVNQCVKMCTIHEMRYHPLMLKSLASLIKWERSILNLDWKERMMKLRSKGIIDKKNAWEKVFIMFDVAYSLLSEERQRVFLDLALYTNVVRNDNQTDEWIRMLHSHLLKEEMDKIILELQDLCFLEKKRGIIILDLLVDFGKYKIWQGVHPEYVLLDGTHLLNDLPRKARTVSISRWGQHDMNRSHMLDLRDVEGVKVLHIVNNEGLQEVLLSGATCTRLRSLIVNVPAGTSLFCTCDGDWSSTSADTGGCLQWVELGGNVCFKSSRLSVRKSLTNLSKAFLDSLNSFEITSARGAMDLVSVLGGLRNLEVLSLSRLPSVHSIDMTTCTNLKNLKLYGMPRLRLLSGFDNPRLKEVLIARCDKVLALTIPADSKTKFAIWCCKSLKRISFCTMPSTYYAGAHSSCIGPGRLSISHCPAFSKLDGLFQYTGSFCFDEYTRSNSLISWERFGDLVTLDAGVDYSKCKAGFQKLELTGNNSAGFAGLQWIALEDAQHAGLLVSALFKAQPAHLQSIYVGCEVGSDCGCNQNAPHFGPLPRPSSDEPLVPAFTYRCPQVKDLASLAQWHVVKSLDLRGCASVKAWPDFAAMTSLEKLNLSFTSLKEWPAGVQRLSHLKWLCMRGCQQLPAQELMKVVTFELQPTMLGRVTCIICSLGDLQVDLKDQSRDRCSVADALDEVYPELVALFDRSSWSLPEVAVLQLVVAIMYDVWLFGEADRQQELQHIRTKMGRLLCSERFLSIPFRACSRGLLSTKSLSMNLRDNFVGGEWELGMTCHVMRVMGLMGIVLVGEGSRACFNASPLNNDLRNNIMNFLKSFTCLDQALTDGAPKNGRVRLLRRIEFEDIWLDWFKMVVLGQDEVEVLRKQVREAVGIWAAELGKAFVDTLIMQGMETDSLDFRLDEADSSDSTLQG